MRVDHTNAIVEVLAGPGGHGVTELLARLEKKGVPIRWWIGASLWVAGRKVPDDDANKPLHEVLVRMFNAERAVKAAILARVDGREWRNRTRRCPTCGAVR